MDELSSSEFRKTYADLTRPTVVKAGKHYIGEWWPAGTITRAINAPEKGEPASYPAPEARLTRSGTQRLAPQARRDAILRKINKGG